MSARLESAIRELVDALRAEIVAAEAGGSAATGPDRLLNVDEAAAALGIRRTSAYQEISAGRLRSLRIGRRRLVPASAITERIEAARAGAASEDRDATATRPAA
jgi:excisionase family DNA binding protein